MRTSRRAGRPTWPLGHAIEETVGEVADLRGPGRVVHPVTTSRSDRAAPARTCAAIVGPTISPHSREEAAEPGRGGQIQAHRLRLERSAEGAWAPVLPTRSGPSRVASRAWTTPPGPIRRSSAAVTSCGGGTAVVRRVWPRRQAGHERPAPVLRRARRRRRRGGGWAAPQTLGGQSWAASRRARANDRCSPWEVCVRAGSPPIRSSTSSRCGPTEVTPRARSTGSMRDQGVGQASVPRSLVPGRRGRRLAAQPSVLVG